MDYSYYQNNPQAYQFLGLPTPGHSNPAVSADDFNNSPTVRAPSFHYVPPVQINQQLSRPQSQEFHHNPSPHYSHSHSHYSHYNSHRSSPVSPPPHSSPFYEHSPVQSTPQTQAFLTPRGQEAYDQFQNFEFSSQFANPTPNPSLQKSATPISQHGASLSSSTNGLNGYEVTKFETGTPINSMDTAQDDAKRAMGQGQSNSEDDDMTPAQSRRKAQNRAAQRAFRERKERHVKDLEAKLLALETQSKSLSSENERLKLQLQRASTENEILKATSSAAHRSVSPPITSGPLRYSPTDFYSEVLQSHENKTPSHRIVVSEGGERLLAAGAAWDYIISHPLVLEGLVDVGDVSERLKTLAKCDGQGPVFEESAIIRAIEMSVASGSDELL